MDTGSIQLVAEISESKLSTPSGIIKHVKTDKTIKNKGINSTNAFSSEGRVYKPRKSLDTVTALRETGEDTVYIKRINVTHRK